MGGVDSAGLLMSSSETAALDRLHRLVLRLLLLLHCRWSCGGRKKTKRYFHSSALLVFAATLALGRTDWEPLSHQGSFGSVRLRTQLGSARPGTPRPCWISESSGFISRVHKRRVGDVCGTWRKGPAAPAWMKRRETSFIYSRRQI